MYLYLTIFTSHYTAVWQSYVFEALQARLQCDNVMWESNEVQNYKFQNELLFSKK